MSKRYFQRFPAIEAGDYVVDPLDGELRQVMSAEGNTLHMMDGGIMGADEVLEVYLPSEIECRRVYA